MPGYGRSTMPRPPRMLMLWVLACALLLPLSSPAQAVEPRTTVIVMLRTAGFSGSAASLDQSIARSSDAQMHLLRRRSELAPRVVHRYTTTPGLVLLLSAAEQAALAADPAVLSIRPNRLYAPALDASTSQIGASVTATAGDAGAGTSVAVLDTGIAAAHPMLSGRVIAEACFSSNDAAYGGTSLCPGAASSATGRNSAAPCGGLDACNHGTHVASIIAGKPVLVDGARLSGVAPATKIIAVQVFSRFDYTNASHVCGVSATEDCVLAFESDILAALDYLTVNYATPSWGTLAAVNLSLSAQPSATDCDADNVDGMGLYKTYVDNLRTLGVATVVAAGNEGSSSGVGHPACISTAISVGSTQTSKSGWDAVDGVSSFSNAPSAAANTPNAGGDRLLDLLAPGSSISAAKAAPAGSYGAYSGTSMAAPHVSGAWAVLKGLAPALSVPAVRDLLRDTGVPITDTRSGTPLVVPRIALDQAVARLRQQTLPVVISPLARDFGMVQHGSVVTQRITLRSQAIAVRLSRGALLAPWSVTSSGCPLVLDDIQTRCVYDVSFAPTAETPAGWYGTTLNIALNGTLIKIGLVARVVPDPPAPGLTQTAIAAPTDVAARTRSLTPTPSATPLAFPLAQTIIADTTRTMRRRETQTSVRAATQTVADARYLTAVATGAATRTPPPPATQTATPSVLPVTKTIARLLTQTAARSAGLTATPWARATQRAAATQTAQADAVSATAAVAAGSPSHTATRTPTRTRGTATPTATATLTRGPTRSPTVSALLATSARTNARYHGFVLRNGGAQALLIHAGDRTKNDPPLLTAVRLSDLQSGTGIALAGQTVSCITVDSTTPDRAFVAGRLDWNSGYIQTVSVGTGGIRFLATTVIPLAPGSDIRTLQSVGTTLWVGIATATPPSALLGGELRAYETRGTLEWFPAAAGSVALAGIPSAILPVDARSDRLVVAGTIDGVSVDTGFVQLVSTTGTLTAYTAVTAALPYTSGVAHNVFVDAERTVLVAVADGTRIALYTVGEDNTVLWRRNDIATKASFLETDGDQIAAFGYATADSKNIVQMYQPFTDALWLRKTAALTNTAGGPSGVAVAPTGLYTLDALRITRLK